MRPEDERPDFDGAEPPGWFPASLVAGVLAAGVLLALALAAG